MNYTYGLFLFNKISNKILICHATRSRNLWSIPKGLAEPDEDPVNAAWRETYEETGIRESDLGKYEIYSLPESPYKKQRKVLVSFLVVFEKDISTMQLNCISMVNENYPEVDKYLWADLSTFKKLAHESQVDLLDKIMGLINP